jgi:acetone carboxylase, gamma subunit
MPGLRMTEYLDLDLDAEVWRCNRCGAELISARSPYKQGCLVYDRDPREIHPPLIEGDYSFSPDPEWVRVLEFYCPGCGVQIETEYLPPGHPVTVDIELDIDRLKRRLAAGEVRVSEGRLVAPDREGERR